MGSGERTSQGLHLLSRLGALVPLGCLPGAMVCRQCILPTRPQRLTHFSGALFVSADSLIFHPSLKDLPNFLVCLREIFPMEVCSLPTLL